MKTVRAVLKYQQIILDKTVNMESIPVSSIKVLPGESESFKHALEDLVISGMIVYTGLNPVVTIKRIA